MDNQLTSKDKVGMFLKYRENQNKQSENVNVSKDNEELCESCGKHKKGIQSHYGKQVCVSCSTMRGIAKSCPDAVVSALKEFYTDKELGAMIGATISASPVETPPVLSVDTSLEHNAGLVDRIAELESECAERVESAERLASRCKFLAHRLCAADEIIRNANKQCESIAWDLAMSKLNDEPITVEGIMALRNIGESITVLVPHDKMEVENGLAVEHPDNSTNCAEARAAN